MRDYIDEESPRGDLARDIDGDETFPGKSSMAAIIRYLDENKACEECFEEFYKAWGEYERERVRENAYRKYKKERGLVP